MSFEPYVVGCAVLAAVVLGLAMYRRFLASHEDDSIHISHDVQMVSTQRALAQRLDVIDRWGKRLTIVLFAACVLVASAFAYKAWVDSFQKLP